CRAKGERGIPKEELIEYMTDAARALDFLNETRHVAADGSAGPIFHRDVKPHNLLLAGGCIRVADFGIAKLVDDQADSGHTAAGTLRYMAPEVAYGRLFPTTDQYSLAATYYYLRTGDFHAGDGAGLPTAERKVVDRSLDLDPTKRWKNCREFVDHLRDTHPAAAPWFQIKKWFRGKQHVAALPSTVSVGEPASVGPNVRVFVNYRKDDSHDRAARIADRLKSHFGVENVFFDDGSIHAGDRFDERILENLRTCDILVAVLGDDWLGAKYDDHCRRLDDPADWVRREIEIMMERGPDRVIPVWVGRKQPPLPEHFPAGILRNKFSYLQRLEIRNGEPFDRDLTELCEDIVRVTYKTQ
ncbi:MAG: protein kinase domain-containing protein, partial [Planctomycetia bacterium]